MFKKSKVCAAALLAIGGSAVLTAVPVFAQDQQLERVEVTGSRIKRAAAEGALPVTVVTREQLEDSGAVTIAEFIRNSTFSSAGQFRPQSGSSAQSFAGVDLRGLGTRRTLVLVDGRRLAKAPNVGDSADMNSIPMAAVERIEILTDGASAIYGSDAIGGVINVILRKDFEGMHYMVGKTYNSVKGGDREEASAMVGLTTDKGRILVGVSRTTRDITYARDYPWGTSVGASSYSNGFYSATPDPDNPGKYLATPASTSSFRGNAGTCDFPDQGFYVDSTGRCRYDFNLVASDEAAIGTKSIFARGEFNISKDWTVYLNASNTNNTSFGRYAPVPDAIQIEPGSVANTSTTPNETVFLWHRFAAAGNRDTSTDGNLNDVALGVQGTFKGFDVDFGVRRTTSKLVETGRGFIVKSLATAAINDGTYNIADPFSNSDEVLKSITTTTGRDSLFSQSEIYANATTDLFAMVGGTSKLYVGFDHRKETYADIYDSLSEAGEVLGSSGSSAGGGRKVDALSAEMLLPIAKTLEGTLAARYEKYSDYGNDFSPKASARWTPTRALTLRASVGRGFAAPSLPTLTQKPAFSADSVIDPRHCAADGSFTVTQCLTESFQINGLSISNPSLGSEKSKQYSFGAAWDVTKSFTVKADYWSTKIDDVISDITAQEIVDRDNGTSRLAIPAGLSITRDPISGAILQIVRGSTNEGVLDYAGIDLNAIFTHKYASLGSFKHEVTWSHVTKAKTNGVDENGEWGTPKDRVQFANGWSRGAFDVTWNINMIGKNGHRTDTYVPTYVTHDLQLTWKPPIKGTTLKVGMINAGEKFPALVGSPHDSKPYNYYLYDAYGRQTYLRFEQKF